MNYFKKQKHFIATFNDPRIEEYEELYDIYVDLTQLKLTKSHYSKDVFLMTKLHKDIAVTFVRTAEKSQTNDQDVLDCINDKTLEILNNLYELLSADNKSNVENDERKKVIKISKIREKFNASNVEQFFVNLAHAEYIQIDYDV